MVFNMIRGELEQKLAESTKELDELRPKVKNLEANCKELE
jgi:hypothetical protein